MDPAPCSGPLQAEGAGRGGEESQPNWAQKLRTFWVIQGTGFEMLLMSAD